MKKNKICKITWITEVFNGAVQNEIEQRIEAFQKSYRRLTNSSIDEIKFSLLTNNFTWNFSASSELHANLLLEILWQV